MINIAGVVILFNPEIEKTIENINSYASALNKLYIFDNSAFSNPTIVSAIDLNVDQIQYIHTGFNLGISMVLNEASRKAIGEGFDYLLTMDQDSKFQSGAFLNYLKKIAENNLENVAQFGVNSDPKYIPLVDDCIFVDSLITSGTILNLEYINKIGFFDEKLFIDFVDVEYSLRAKYNGFVNILYRGIVMNHAIGYIKMGRSLKNFKKTPRILHAPIRVYYIVRNGFYMMFRLKHLGKVEKQNILLDHMKMLKNDFIYNDKLIDVYKFAFLGFIHFVRNKMYKYGD